MAILKDIKVAIVVNGQELREYDDEDAGDDDQNSVSKYVEATSGAEFQIATSAPMWYEFASDAVVMTIYVDGVCVEQGLFRKEKVGWSGAWNRSFAGPSSFDGDGWKLKPFKFIDIKAGMPYSGIKLR